MGDSSYPDDIVQQRVKDAAKIVESFDSHVSQIYPGIPVGSTIPASTKIANLAVINWDDFVVTRYEFPHAPFDESLRDKDWNTKLDSYMTFLPLRRQVSVIPGYSPSLSNLTEKERLKYFEDFWSAVGDYLPDRFALPMGDKRPPIQRTVTFRTELDLTLKNGSELEKRFHTVYFLAEGDKEPANPDDYLAVVKLRKKGPNSTGVVGIYGQGQTNLSRFVAKEFDDWTRARTFCTIAENLIEAYFAHGAGAILLSDVIFKVPPNYETKKDVGRDQIALNLQIAGNASGMVLHAYTEMFKTYRFTKSPTKSPIYSLNMVIKPNTQRTFTEVERYYRGVPYCSFTAMFLREHNVPVSDQDIKCGQQTGLMEFNYSVRDLFSNGPVELPIYDPTSFIKASNFSRAPNVKIAKLYPIKDDEIMWIAKSTDVNPFGKPPFTTFPRSKHLYIPYFKGDLCDVGKAKMITEYRAELANSLAMNPNDVSPFKVHFYELNDDARLNRLYEVATDIYCAAVRTQMRMVIENLHQCQGSSSLFAKIINYCIGTRKSAIRASNDDFVSILKEIKIADDSGNQLALLAEQKGENKEYVLNVPVFEIGCKGFAKTVAQAMMGSNGKNPFVEEMSPTSIKFFAAAGPDAFDEKKTPRSQYDSPIAVVIVPQNDDKTATYNMIRYVCAPGATILVISYPTRAYARQTSYADSFFEYDTPTPLGVELTNHVDPVEVQWALIKEGKPSLEEAVKNLERFYGNVASASEVGSDAEYGIGYRTALDQCSKGKFVESAIDIIEQLSLSVKKPQIYLVLKQDDIGTVFAKHQISKLKNLKVDATIVGLEDVLINSDTYSSHVLLVPFRNYVDLVSVHFSMKRISLYHALYYESTLATNRSYDKAPLPSELKESAFFIGDECNLTKALVERYVGGFIINNAVLLGDHTYRTLYESSFESGSDGNERFVAMAAKVTRAVARNNIFVYSDFYDKSSQEYPGDSAVELADVLSTIFQFLEKKIKFVAVSKDVLKHHQETESSLLPNAPKKSFLKSAGAVGIFMKCPGVKALKMPVLRRRVEEDPDALFGIVPSYSDKKGTVCKPRDTFVASLVEDQSQTIASEMDRFVTWSLFEYYRYDMMIDLDALCNAVKSVRISEQNKLATQEIRLLHEEYDENEPEYWRTQLWVQFARIMMRERLPDVSITSMSIDKFEIDDNTYKDLYPYVVVGENNEIESVRTRAKTNSPAVHLFDISFSSIEESDSDQFCACPYQDNYVVRASTHWSKNSLERAANLIRETFRLILETDPYAKAKDDKTLTDSAKREAEDFVYLPRYVAEKGDDVKIDKDNLLVVGKYMNPAVVRGYALRVPEKFKGKGKIYYAPYEYAEMLFEYIPNAYVVSPEGTRIQDIGVHTGNVHLLTPSTPIDDGYFYKRSKKSKEEIFSNKGEVSGYRRVEDLDYPLRSFVHSVSLSLSKQWSDFFKKKSKANDKIKEVIVVVHAYNSEGRSLDSSDFKKYKIAEKNGYEDLIKYLPFLEGVRYVPPEEKKEDDKGIVNLALALVRKDEVCEPNAIAIAHKRAHGIKPSMVVVERESVLAPFGTNCGTNRIFYAANDNLQAVNTMSFDKFVRSLMDRYSLAINEKSRDLIVGYRYNLDKIQDRKPSFLIYPVRVPDDTAVYFGETLGSILQKLFFQSIFEGGVKALYYPEFKVVSEETRDLNKAVELYALETRKAAVYLVPSDLIGGYTSKITNNKWNDNPILFVIYERATPLIKNSKSIRESIDTFAKEASKTKNVDVMIMPSYTGEYKTDENWEKKAFETIIAFASKMNQ